MTQTSASPAFDESDLAALNESIADVLNSEADRAALHRHIDGKAPLDDVLWSKAAELGWLAIGLPECDGGLGFGVTGLDLLLRRLGHHVAPGPFTSTLAAAQSISEVADAATREAWLPRIATGTCRLAVAAHPGETALGDAWLLAGQGCEAALVPLGTGEWGIVPLESARAETMWDRTRTMLTLDLAGVAPLATLPGKATAEALTRHLALAIAADAIGGTRAIIALTVDYMMQREQFGRTIASFQALKHRVADHMAELVSGEHFLDLAVESAARGDVDAGVWARLAKARCTQSYARIAEDCLQLHGGVGFTWEFDVHMYLNRARLNEHLVAPNPELKDAAVAGLADAMRAGRAPLELA